MIGVSRLETMLGSFPRLTIALVGDLFLDRYLEIEAGVHELSIETGLEAWQVAQVRNSPGALGTVMNNLAALGVGKLKPVTVIGDDGHGFDLLRAIEPLPADRSHIVIDAERLTPTYTKPLQPEPAGGRRELNRIDVRTRAPLSAAVSTRLCDQLREAFDGSDGLIVLDQVNEHNWGVVNDQVRGVLHELTAQHAGKLVFIDSRAHLRLFSRGVLKGNRSELLTAAGVPDDGGEASVRRAAEQLVARTGQSVFCTLGQAGILVAQPDGRTEISPAVPVSEPIDIVGAGDSATSGIVASLLSGASKMEAASVANLVASITVEQLGTTGTASPAQVLARRRACGSC